MYKENDVTHFNQKLESFWAKRCWDECLVKSKLSQRRQNIEEFNQQNRYVIFYNRFLFNTVFELGFKQLYIFPGF